MSETNKQEPTYSSIAFYLLGGLFVHTTIIALFTLCYNYLAPDFSLPSLHMGKIACLYFLIQVLKRDKVSS